MKLLKLPAIAFVLIAISTHVHSQLWKQYADSAKVYRDKKNYDSAIILNLKAIEQLKNDSSETLTYARICNALANSYTDKNQYNNAETLYIKAKKIREKISGKMNADYATSISNLGRLYRIRGEYEKAEPLYLESKQIRENVLGKESADYAASCNNLGNLYKDMAQYDKAEIFDLEAKQVREKVLGKNDPLYAISCNNLAVLYEDIGLYKKAESLYLESKQIQENLLGKNNNDYAASCDNLAGLYRAMGEYQKAELLYIEAKQIREKVIGKNDPVYAASCNNLGDLYRDLGQYENAKILFLEAKEVWGKSLGKNHPYYTGVVINLAELYNGIGEYQKAKSLNLEVYEINRKKTDKTYSNYTLSCESLANSYTNIGEYKMAEPLYLEAKAINEKSFGKENLAYASVCNNLANFYTKVNKYKQAQALYVEAKQIREKILGTGHPDYITSCFNLANLYWQMKEPGKATTLYTEAFQSQNTQTNKIFRFTNEAEKQSYLKRTEDLENYLLSFNKSIYPGAYAGFCYDVSLFNRNLILSSSQQLRNEIYNSTDTSIKSKYNNWMNLREQLAYWYAKPVTARAAYVKDFEQQTDSIEKELTRISSDFKKEQSQSSDSWESVQQNLKSNEAAIEFINFHFYNGKRWTDSTYYIALLLKKNKEPEFISLFESRQLNNIIKTGDSYKTITAIYKNDKFNKAYNLIWKPIDKHLTGITKIYFAPAGLLYRISLQALPVNYNQVLSDKYQLVQLGTTASLTGNQSKKIIDTSDKINLYGGIQFDADSATLTQAAIAYHNNTTVETTRFIADDITRDNSWQYLPGTAKEINEIDSIGKEKNYAVFSSAGTQASEESIQALNGFASPAVLHIATHGFFFPDPKQDTIKNNFESGNVFRQSDNPLFRSGLLFAGANNAWKGKQIEGVEDGILTAYEVSNLYLPNTKLVVLSACETGLGDIQGNEGVYGLQRAFKIAGVENLIMSLWKVPDKETAEFMQLFYRNIFDKQSISDAFYSAQNVMKNNYRNEPYKWAAWILVR